MDNILVKLTIAILTTVTWVDYAYTAPIRVDVRMDGQSFGRDLEIYLDQDGDKKIEEIQAANFVAADKDVPNFGFTPAIVWARFQLQNTSDQPQRILIEYKYASVDFVTLYELSEGGPLALTLGDKVPFTRRMIQNRYPVFDVNVAPGTHSYYLRIETQGTTIIPLFFWDVASFQGFVFKDNLALGLLFGVLFGMALYNLFLYLTVKTKVYFYYVCYLIFFSIHALSAQGVSQFLFMPASYDHWLSNEGFLIFAEISTIFMVLFAIHFLNIKSNHPWLYKFFLLHRAVAILDIINIQFYSYEIGAKVANLNVAIGMVLMITAGLISSYKRYRPAYFYTLAWFIFLLGSLSMVLKYQGILPVNLITEWANLAGAAVESILLSIALGVRMNYYRNKAETEIHFLNSQLKQHIAQVELIVEEKTRDIRSILRNIKQGVFMIANDGSIHREFSVFLPELFGKPVNSEVSAVAYLFQGSSVSDDQYDQIDCSVESILGNHFVNYEANRGNLPREFNILHHDRKRILEIEWSPIVDDHETVNKILVCVRDVTDFKRLAKEADEHKDKMGLIEKIIDLSPEKFDHFFENTTQLFAEITEAMGDSKFGRVHLTQIYRNLHTLKGVSRIFGFHDLSNRIHQMETATQTFLTDVESNACKKDLFVALALLKETFEKLYDINYRLLDRKFATKAHRDGDFVSFVHSMNEFLAALRKQGEIDASEGFVKTIIGEFFFNMSYMLTDIEGTLALEAKKIGCVVPTIEIKNDTVHFLPHCHNLIKNTLVHLINNSMAHGFSADGEAGQICIELQIQPDNLCVNFSDSGRGLNLAKIRDIAIEKGLIPVGSELDPASIANLIFLPGFSTQDRVSDIAGRGIGMDAVKSMLEKFKGSINIVLNPDQEAARNSAYQAFSLVVTLSSDLYIAMESSSSSQLAA